MIYVCFECDSVELKAGRCAECGGNREALSEPQEGPKKGLAEEERGTTTWRVWEGKKGIRCAAKGGGYVGNIAGDGVLIREGAGNDI